jgi:hypothetical protein
MSGKSETSIFYQWHKREYELFLQQKGNYPIGKNHILVHQRFELSTIPQTDLCAAKD